MKIAENIITTQETLSFKLYEQTATNIGGKLQIVKSNEMSKK